MTDDVLAAAAELVRAFGEHRTSDYFACFSDDASFVFYTHGEMLDSRHAYEQLWHEWETTSGFRVHGCRSSGATVRFATPEVAIFTHDVETDLTIDGARSTSHERETIVFRRDASGWLAVHEHLSPAPAVDDHADS